jgi:hypothetical protein
MAGAAEVDAPLGVAHLERDVLGDEAALVDQRDPHRAQTPGEQPVAFRVDEQERLARELVALGGALLEHEHAQPALAEPHRGDQAGQRRAEHQHVPAPDPMRLRARDRRKAAHQPASGPRKSGGSSGLRTSISPIR